MENVQQQPDEMAGFFNRLKGMDRETLRKNVKKFTEAAKALPHKTHSVRACGVQVATNVDWVKEDFKSYKDSTVKTGKRIFSAVKGIAHGAKEGWKSQQ